MCWIYYPQKHQTQSFMFLCLCIASKEEYWKILKLKFCWFHDKARNVKRKKTNMVEYSFLRTPFGKTLMLHSVLFLSLSDLLIWIHWLFVYRHRWSSGPKMTVAWKRSSIIQLVSTKKWASKEENWRRTEITTPSLLRICVDHCDW